jgi:hypothetical protein
VLSRKVARRKDRWRELIACERKNDLGLDAVVFQFSADVFQACP